MHNIYALFMLHCCFLLRKRQSSLYEHWYESGMTPMPYVAPPQSQNSPGFPYTHISVPSPYPLYLHLSSTEGKHFPWTESIAIILLSPYSLHSRSKENQSCHPTFAFVTLTNYGSVYSLPLQKSSAPMRSRPVTPRPPFWTPSPHSSVYACEMRRCYLYNIPLESSHVILH